MAISTLNLSELDETQGFVITGVNNGENSGYSVSDAGDINGDGVDDLIIGAPGGGYYNYYGYGYYGSGSGGRSYVVFGGSDVGDSGSLELSQLDGSNGFVINGIDNNDNAGSSVSNAGDINGDGIDDLIIGAPNADNSSNYSDEGESYVVFGSDDGFDANLELSELDGSSGFVITGIDNYDNSGRSVSSAGDVNGDGIDDLIIGAPNADNSDNYSSEGESYVVFGSSDGFADSLDLAELDGSNGFVISGIDNYDNSGRSVSSAGDVNGDGIDDLIIGAPYAGEYTYYGSNSEGESYVVFGGSDVGDSGSLELSQLNGSNGFIISGIDNYDNSGRSVSNAGDINGDGIDDLIIGAPNADSSGNYSDEGESYVVFGNSDGFAASLELSELDGNNGFVITGADNNDNLGRSVSGAGDVNGDGIDDLIIGAPYADSSSNYGSQGESYVVFGNSDGFAASLDLSNLDDINGLLITGIDNGDNLGRSVSGAGDINGDGVDDIIIGAPNADRGDNYSREGESYVVFGVVPLELTGTSDDDVLTGGNGDDFLSGLGGNDILQGAGGRDEILGGSGDDLITGGEEDDTVKGQGGDDNISGNDGDDSLIGNSGSDDIVGGNGNDTIEGGSESDRLLGEAGNDSIRGGAGGDRILGGDGDDDLGGLSGDDLIIGDDGNDYLDGCSGNDTLEGGAGDDLVLGGDGADEITGNDGNDSLRGGAGDDTLIGGSGDDSLNGNANNDLLIGIDPNSSDSDFGLGELDTLTGGADNDTFVLADESRVFYDDGDNFAAGDEDFALITNFDSNQDTIQLQGSADFYSLDFFTSDAGSVDAKLVYDPGIAATGETIAVLENVDPDLSIDDSAFTFI
ncbi:MAG: calcium-binding protein [Pleurocapsa sp. MO_192.B19]|nr:calcium-binding protein [Pleurocapsa sp. MO_192.B19]